MEPVIELKRSVSSFIGRERHTKNDRHLHLQRVQVGQLSSGAMPGRVHSEGIGRLSCRSQALIEHCWAKGGV